MTSGGGCEVTAQDCYIRTLCAQSSTILQAKSVTTRRSRNRQLSTKYRRLPRSSDLRNTDSIRAGFIHSLSMGSHLPFAVEQTRSKFRHVIQQHYTASLVLRAMMIQIHMFLVTIAHRFEGFVPPDCEANFYFFVKNKVEYLAINLYPLPLMFRGRKPNKVALLVHSSKFRHNACGLRA